MIKGEIKMTFNDEGVDIHTSIKCTKAFEDKCFIIDALCGALKIEGFEKTLTLAMVAASDDLEKEDVEETKEEENESRCI